MVSSLISPCGDGICYNLGSQISDDFRTKDYPLKNLVLALAVSISAFAFSTEARAQQFFAVSANCNFNSATGNCEVYNNFPQPIACSLRAQGSLASGHVMWAYNNVVIAPGAMAYVYVNAPYGNPLVNVSGSANCRF